MSRFNTSLKEKDYADTENLAGGAAYALAPQVELATIAFTSFIKKAYYRSGDQTIERIRELIPQCDPQYVARLAIYARHVFGMRSVTHVIAGELAADKRVRGEEWAKNFFCAVIRRVDDMNEILAYYKSINNGKLKPLPNAVKKGFKMKIGTFSPYQLAKYRNEKSDIKLVDIFNLVHPKAMIDEKETAYKDLMGGNLKSEGTWEYKLTQAGQNGTSKKDAWTELVVEKKLPYFALLRNLRNIYENTSRKTFSVALEQLQDKETILKSLVLPFRFVTCYKEFQKISGMDSVTLDLFTDAINEAFKHSCYNILMPEGETLVAIDCSGSMQDVVGKAGPIALAALQQRKGDLVLFDDTAKFFQLVRRMEPMAAIDFLYQNFQGGATRFSSIFELLTKKYDNIIIVSDMQSWVDDGYSWSCGRRGRNGATEALANYRRKFQADPNVQLIDVAGNGSAQFPEHRVATIAGFARETLVLLADLADNPQVMIDKINATEI